MRGPTVALVAAFLPQHAAGGGASGCRCLTQFPPAWRQQWVVNGSCQLFRGPAYTGNPQQSDFCYAADYGLSNCSTWDQGQPPLCSRTIPPAWCADQWCYVDGKSCSLGDATPTSREVSGMATEDLPHYSYVTCGFANENLFAKYHRASLKSAAEIVETVGSYVAQLRDHIERQLPVLNDDESGDCPDFVDSCRCTQCAPGDGTWQSGPLAREPGGYSVDFRSVTVTHTDGNTGRTKTPAERRAQCLSQLVQNRFKQIARLEYNDPSRMAFLQYGDQASAVYFSWPGTTFCPSAYDPRFRPWYVSAVSGPKDVVIVMDSSGSMRLQNRWNLARQAAKKVLSTLTEHDYANIVLFSSSAKTFELASGNTVQQTNVLQKVTQQTLRQMEDWIDSEAAAGGTNFRTGFQAAFNLLSRSAAQGISSRCNQAILFLTDGQDSENFVESELRSLNTDAVAIFTYSFGSDADKTLPKEIACRNYGIWYHVEDVSNIGEVMSGYYMYYAGALASAKQIRWTHYREYTTGHELFTGCLPAYERAATPAQLLGVVCMDVSTIISVESFIGKLDFTAAQAIMDQEASTCTMVHLGEAALEELRAAVSRESVCSVSASSTSKVHDSRTMQWLTALALFLLWADGHR